VEETETAELLLAYTRRRRFEAKLLAAELAGLLAPGMMMTHAAGGGRTSHSGQRGGHRANHVHADQLLGEMGITIQ
jgi:hypothetical protein